MTRTALLAACIALGVGCGGAPPRSPSGAALLRSTGAGRPSLAGVVRDGDARGALAVAVNTEGIAPDRGALAAVALAALVQARLAARGVDATVTGGWGGWRARVLAIAPGDIAATVDAVRSALLDPVAPGEAALAEVSQRVSALSRRPMADRALIDVVECTGEAYATGAETPPSPADLEAWRQAAHGLGRVVIGAAGDSALVDAAAAALSRAPAWPRAAAPSEPPWPPPGARAVSYDASGEIAPGAARVVVVARTAAPERAVAAAPALGDPHGPLATRLAALDAPARIRSVIATAHPNGGCIAATMDMSARDLTADAARQVATAAALARQELAVEIQDAVVPADLGRSLVTRAVDPREAAERAAWWALAGPRPDQDARLTVVVGIARGRDSPEAASPDRTEAIRAEIDRATVAWHAPVVESHVRVERGQGETWILFASTCGVLSEAAVDAGVTAVVAAAASAQTERGDDATLEPFVATDGAGVLVHGPPRPGESAQALVRRLADAAARGFAADPIDPDRVARVRTELLARSAQPDAKALSALANVLAPGHPSWIQPTGTSVGLSYASAAAIGMRAASLRAGPLRVAVLANESDAQADAAVRAVDRWVARRPGEARSCPTPPTLAPARPGTYAVDLEPGALPEVLLAAPLPPGDEGARAAAVTLAAVLDGPDGMLSRAMGAPGATEPTGHGIARTSGATVLGDTHAPALVVRLTAPDATLDAAVAQTRALLDRLRQGALREEDRLRAVGAIARSRLALSLDPRSRAIALWRGDPSAPGAPSLDALRAFASTALRDDNLVIVAARPRRPDLDLHPPPGRESKVRLRD
ncbi:MAG TPA: hypothetical protein VKU41_11160 [Polyangiaceae bacterium]|nr:hypothetical protein [Polyangiaceae bacterium]